MYNKVLIVIIGIVILAFVATDSTPKEFFDSIGVLVSKELSKEADAYRAK